MQNERRIFIPGDCATGPSAPVFIELDSGSTDPNLLALGQEACRSCLQLPHCDQQRQGIAEELGSRQAMGPTIVGAKVVDIPESANDETAPPVESSFTFDLQYPLTEPRHVLEVIRQAFRSKQITTYGIEATQHEVLSAYLQAKLTEQNETQKLTANELAVWSRMSARLYLKYHRVLHQDWPRRKQRAPLSENEMSAAASVQTVFVKDVLALRDAGFLEPETVAQAHTPDFYKRVIRVYGSSFNINMAHIRKAAYESPIDPVTAIEKRIDKNRRQKEAAISGRDKEPVAPEELSKSARIREAMRKHKSWGGHTRELPELKPFLRMICSNNLNDPDSVIKELFKDVRRLQKNHPACDTTALIHLAYHQKENIEGAVAEYKEVLSDLQKHYRGDAGLTEKRLNRFAFTHLSSAKDEVEAYLHRLAALKATCEEANISLPDDVLWATAEKIKRKLTALELQQKVQEKQLRASIEKTLPKLPGIEGWMVGKVSRIYKMEKAKTVLANMSRFLRREYLIVVQPDSREDLITKKYDIADKKTGKHLGLGILTYFSPEEQEAVLASFDLDRIVLGYEVDKERLLAFFKVPDLDAFVDTNLLPYTRYIDVDRKNPADLLYAVRCFRRDKKDVLSKDKESKAIYDKRLDLTMTYLIKKYPQNPELADPACRSGVKRILSWIQNEFPWRVFNKDLVVIQELATLYLEEAWQIKQLGYANPYRMALSYSSTFCREFLVMSRNEEWQPTKGDLSNMLRNLSGQATLELRRQRQLVKAIAPEFKSRKIGISYLELHHKEANIRHRLALYDETVKVYPSTTLRHAIHYYCFGTSVPDPVAEIRSWQSRVARVGSSYKRIIGVPNIKHIALGKSGEDLTKTLDDCVALFNELLAEHTQSPHPAIDTGVIRHLVKNPLNIRKQLTAQKRRWDEVHANLEIATTLEIMDAAVLRRIILLRRTDPVGAIREYKQLQDAYKYDQYIEPSMIDDAIRWSMGQAAGSIRRLRQLLQKTEVKRISLYKKRNDKGDDAREFHDTLPDTKTPSVDAHIISSQIDPEAPTREQTKLRVLLERLSPAEAAAVATFYNVPWILPQALQDDGWAEPDKVCETFNVRDVDQLKPAVEDILNKIRS